MNSKWIRVLILVGLVTGLILYNLASSGWFSSNELPKIGGKYEDANIERDISVENLHIKLGNESTLSEKSKTPSNTGNILEDENVRTTNFVMNKHLKLATSENGLFKFETHPYPAHWVKEDGAFLDRVSYFIQALTELRTNIKSQRGIRPWKDIHPVLRVVWESHDDFLHQLGNATEVQTLSLSWVNDKPSVLKDQVTHTISRNWLIHDYYTWIATEPLCEWIKSKGFTKAHYDAVFNRSCTSEIEASSNVIPLAPIYLNAKPIDRHYHPNNSFKYNDHFYSNYPDHVFYVHIVQDGVVTRNGNVISGSLKLVPYSCSHETEPVAPSYQSGPIYSEVFMMSGLWGEEYFHKMAEQYPRIAPYIEFLFRFPGIKIHTMELGGGTADMLQRLGISPERLITGDCRAKIIYLPRQTPCGFVLAQEVQLLSHRLHSINSAKLQSNSSSEKPLLLLIERSRMRRLRNAGAIRGIVMALAESHGMEFQLFSDRHIPSMDETMRIFSRARLVVAPHGAGLSNLIYAKPGTYVVEGVCNPPHVNLCYLRLAHVLGMHYHAIPSRSGCEDIIDIPIGIIEDTVKWYVDRITNSNVQVQVNGTKVQTSYIIDTAQNVSYPQAYQGKLPPKSNSTEEYIQLPNKRDFKTALFQFKKSPYPAYWVNPEGDFLNRIKVYNDALTEIRDLIKTHRGVKNWKNIENYVHVVWSTHDDFLHTLANFSEVRTLALTWDSEVAKSSLPGKSEWSSQYDKSNLLIQDYHPWIATQPLCTWIQRPRFTNQHFDVVFNRRCTSDVQDSLKNTSLELVSLNAKPVNKNHYWPNDGISYPPHVLTQTPDHVLFTNILEDAVLTTNGNVLSRTLKYVPYSCSHETNPEPPNYYKASPIYTEVFMVSGFWGREYFHLNVEQIPRIAPYVEFLMRHPDIKIHAMQQGGRTVELLRILGISADRLIVGDCRAKIVYIPRQTGCAFGNAPELQLLSSMYQAYIDVKFKNIKFPGSQATLLLIERSGTRRFRDGDIINRMMRQLASQYNLQFYLFSDRNIPNLDETMLMFSRARLVVAPHGAGLSNLVFSRKETYVVEGVCNPPHVNMCFQRLAHLLGMHYQAIPSTNGCEGYINVNPGAIEQAVKWYLDRMRERNII